MKTFLLKKIWLIKSSLFIIICFILCAPRLANAQSWQAVGFNDFASASDGIIIHSASATDNNGDLYIAYTATSNSNTISLRKFNKSTSGWENIGSGYLTTNGISNLALAIATDGTFYVAYRGYTVNTHLTLMKFSGTDWARLGETLPTGYGSDIALQLDKNQIPYVSYHTNVHSGARVARMVNNSWEIVGANYLSSGLIYDIHLEFDSKNTPYVAFRTPEVSNRTMYVAKFVNNNWETLGSTAIIQSYPIAMTFTISAQDIPIIAFNTTYSVYARQFNGTSWENSGGYAVLDGNGISNLKITTSENGEPYLFIYERNIQANTKKTWVMKRRHLASSWEQIGNTHHIQGTVEDVNLLFNKFGQLFQITDEGQPAKVVVRTYDADTDIWAIFGISGVTSSYTSYFALALDHQFTPYIAYRNANNKAALQKFNGAVWEDIGIAGEFYHAGKGEVSLAHHQTNGTPYTLFGSAADDGKATVYKLSTANVWNKVGTAASTGRIAAPAMIISSGTPIIAYTDDAFESRIVVKRYHSATSVWENIGNSGLGAVNAKNILLAEDKNGMLYLSYQTPENSASLMRFNGNSWENLGNIPGNVSNFSMALSVNNTPYIAYQTSGQDGTIVVMKYNSDSNMKNNTFWEKVGNLESDGFETGSIHLIFDKAGNPIVAYTNKKVNRQAVVKRFYGNEWQSLGEANQLSQGNISMVKIAISDDGKLYTAYNSQDIFVKSFDTTTLPVKLLSFTAKQYATYIRLNWQTASEKNSHSFDVEKRTDKTAFRKIGSVTAAGNSNEKLSYSFNDYDTNTSEKTYYRLKLTDLDNSFEYSDAIVLTAQSAAEKTIIYPNPASSVINISRKSSNPIDKSLKITDVLGQVCIQVDGAERQIDISMLKPGIYYLSTDEEIIPFVKK